ncbi:acyl-CoA thioesterase YbgC [mine drainage metagenome]|uniref:Acyl-CoA thioesterase YbgC n=1 Tax=mine drainage metagenome TaxID=410659 RepID=A0A1J5SEI9_9ZZZZ
MSQRNYHQFVWPVRVYYEDTDSGGVVYHSNYLNFMERARTEWLRALGFEQPVLKNELGVIFVVHSMTIGFKRPAYFNDMLDVKNRLVKIGHGSMEFSQIIVRENQLLLDATVKLACVDATSFKPQGIPVVVKQKIINNSNLNKPVEQL